MADRRRPRRAAGGRSIIGLVAAGLGIAIVPSGLSYIRIPNVAFKELADSDAETDLLLAFRAGEENPRLTQSTSDACRGAEG